MSEAHWHLLSYDIRDDKRRRKVARCLEGHGDRVQFSVFRVHCTPRRLLQIRLELGTVMKDVDNLLTIPLPDHIARRIQTLTEPDDWTEDRAKTWRIVG